MPTLLRAVADHGPSGRQHDYPQPVARERPSQEKETKRVTGKVIAAVAVSLDGFVAGPGDSPEQPLGLHGDRLFTWFYNGDTPGRFYPWMKMSAASAAAFDGFIARIGAVITGRRTYDVAQAWHGQGEVPGAPLFVVTHQVPDQVPLADPPYTFVTDGIASAVRQALAAAEGRDVRLMGASIVQQCLSSGLLDELTIELVPTLLGRGVRLLDGLQPGAAGLEVVRVVDAPGVTHLTYQILR
jgi:dihydrofolate reductase